ncbi:hypothetical protein MXD81_56615 [Microbacteriaceae bacterium K1510]|nr:hypothetical protein [Microbacteriaceae bacterium K1510]
MAKRTRAPSARRHHYTPELLAHGRHRYENTEDSIADIAVEFGVHKATLARLAKRENWVRYVPPPRDVSGATRLATQAAALEEKGPATDVSAQQPTASDPSPVADAERVSREIERLIAGVSTELDIYEAMRARLKHLPQSPLDAERTARTLSALTTTLHRLQRLRAGHIENTPHDDYDDIPTDLDAFRDELARRINEFVRSRSNG